MNCSPPADSQNARIDVDRFLRSRYVLFGFIFELYRFERRSVVIEKRRAFFVDHIRQTDQPKRYPDLSQPHGLLDGRSVLERLGQFSTGDRDAQALIDQPLDLPPAGIAWPVRSTT